MLHSIERECFTLAAFKKDHLTYLLESPKSISLVAQTDNEITGFIIGRIHDHPATRSAHVYTLDVAVKHRRKGIGSRLLEELEKRFTDNGVEICYLEARRGNVAALELYERHGYIKAGILKDFYAEGVDGIRLLKRLSSPLENV
jgi:ribosomal-protein-alanine N-acetyltransferase